MLGADQKTIIRKTELGVDRLSVSGLQFQFPLHDSSFRSDRGPTKELLSYSQTMRTLMIWGSDSKIFEAPLHESYRKFMDMSHNWPVAHSQKLEKDTLH
jgi:hypothetical protein